jgi:prepilin-type N-terminal cleavage/methylation domain-containing protein
MRISRVGICKGGFTLLEFLVVLFLVSVVIAIVFPSFPNFSDRRLGAEAREMASILRYMYDTAISRKETFSVTFDLGESTVSWKGPEGEKTRKFNTITAVATQSSGSVSAGELICYFEPLGVRENIQVHMRSDDKGMTVTLHHLSGRVKIKDEGTRMNYEN